MTTVFDPLQMGDIALSNRIAMAPLTRNRAPGGVPCERMVTYYRQRASAGLIITEGSPVAPLAHGYLDTPGIYTTEQVAGWRRVTDAVHAEGGHIVVQLWHVGRISHTSLLPAGEVPVSSTAHAARSRTFTAEGFVPTSTPRALRSEEVPQVVEQFRHAARCALQAGFDGVEVHGANGYLIEQFLRDSINDRTDEWGGSIANRVRLLQAVMAAVCGEIGSGRTGLRLSPVTPVNDAGQDSDAQALYEAAVRAVAPLGLAYLHVIEGQTGGSRDLSEQGVRPFDYAALRRLFPGAWMVNNGYDRAMALQAVASGAADLVSFGKGYIANPDLVRRLREDAPWNPLDAARLYGGGDAGYIDYPALEA